MKLDNATLTQNLQERIRRCGLTRSAVARQIGISAAAVSQVLAGTYQGDGKAIWPKIQEYLDLEEQRAHYESPTSSGEIYVETEQSSAVASVLAFCNLKRALGVVYGAAGLGKTTTARQYAAENSNVKIITCSALTSIWTLLDEIAEIVRADMKPRRELVRNIIRALQGSNTVLVFDESQHLTTHDYEVLRAIHDGAEIGIVFLGTSAVYDRMTGSRGRLYDQLYSRVGIQRGLRQIVAKGDILRVASAHLGVKPDNEVVMELHRLANTHGGYRRVVKALDMAIVLARQAGQATPTAENIRQAAAHLWQTPN